MKIAALDSSSLVASVAIVEDSILSAEYTVNYKKTHSQTLLPMLDEISRMIGLDLATIDAVAIASGPGSFTGLRIGAATAKGLALALSKPIVPVPTLEAMAFNLYTADALAVPIMDARRNQVYTGIYTFEETLERTLEREISLKVLLDQSAVSITELIEILNKMNRKVIFAGDGIPVYADIIKEKLLVPFSFAPAHLNRQRAAAVAALGSIYYKQGKMESAALHKPEYLRLSQAERELAEKRALKK